MRNYYKSEKVFKDIEQEKRPMSFSIGAGDLVTTFDHSNTKNPINTSIKRDIQHQQNKRYSSNIHQKHQGPQDYLIWSIVNVFIFFILALPALFFSVQVREMKRINNYEKAKYYSKRCLILNIVGSVMGLLGITLAIIFRFALYHLFVQNDVQSQNVPLNGSG
jgi:hypothetical protein